MVLPFTPAQIGLAGCVVIFAVWLLIGKKSWKDLPIVLVGCVAIFLVVANWDIIIAGSHVLTTSPSSSTVQAHGVLQASVVATGHGAVHGPSASHVTTSRQQPSTLKATQAAGSPSLASFATTLAPFALLFAIVAVIGALIGATRKKARRLRSTPLTEFQPVNSTSQTTVPLHTGGCPGCGQARPVQAYKWREGKTWYERSLCTQCATKIGLA